MEVAVSANTAVAIIVPAAIVNIVGIVAVVTITNDLRFMVVTDIKEKAMEAVANLADL
ncbi:hypothetical protein [Radiobacillus sp. PE A8.2]|uniref:hypothetical protein n=1 Tax=Radiobacillus sp. PE A8.2 TaxID=3380349 RepID=UPI00388E7EE2